ncbi:DUF3604 domain-containing protein [Parahaliea aestuarii]|uniref:DUF3604 domain-containing protein n=1 Tax=Parahaliea aestuarii TaxID=1852021 RepID=A0A5C9A683_9GAMM|nr:DUF3604 domain-containing protein [Parahaliea aestuarii]TXS95067.1 DUF3604 domain-containing protein [Parahaliea aestuarii]
MHRFKKRTLLLPALLLCHTAFTHSDEAYSPPTREGTTQLYWGDTHLHTALSADAFINGTRLGPEDSYRFARGEAVTADNGMQARLRAPLDFLAVTDHSDYLGVYRGLAREDEALAGWAVGDEWSAMLAEERLGELVRAFGSAVQSSDDALKTPEAFVYSTWMEVADIADQFNQPGMFTTLIGYEWTSMISGDNLHRVVFYRDDADTVTRQLPFTSQESTDPEDLWQSLADYEEKTGGQVLAIAHNGNVSNGRMFAPETLKGKALDSDYAKTRSRWEPVYEVTQVKGDGETHPTLSPTDEFADFETWDQGNISLTADKEPWMLRYEYARSALREGLRHQDKTGTNPFKFGMIGSTDSHTALSTTAEDNFFGKFLESEPAPDRATNRMAHVLQESWELGASGLAAVWATDNTREAIFDAFRRKEVYGTTGPRIRLRFFGAWNMDPALYERPDYADIAYEQGVPMGGDLLPQGGTTPPPSFLVVAEKEPDGANLDRIQIVKGWLDAAGESHERVYNVALSDERHADPDTGKVPPLPTTADVANATYRNSVGAASLATVWTDPDFEPGQAAFYYVRVLEITKPRWNAYDAAYFDKTMPDKAPMTVQDRAYSSPIWYTPDSES